LGKSRERGGKRGRLTVKRGDVEERDLLPNQRMGKNVFDHYSSQEATRKGGMSPPGNGGKKSLTTDGQKG